MNITILIVALMALITAIILFSITLTIVKGYNLQIKQISDTTIELKRLLKEKWDSKENDSTKDTI